MSIELKTDLYKNLALKNFASKEEIKKRYRKLVMVHHPDRGGDEEIMKKINVAYDVLMNEKATYDCWLRQQLAPRMSPQVFTPVYEYAGNWGSSATDNATAGPIFHFNSMGL